MRLFKVGLLVFLIGCVLANASTQSHRIEAQQTIDSIYANPSVWQESLSNTVDSTPKNLAILGTLYSIDKQNELSIDLLNKAIHKAKTKKDTTALILAYQAAYKPNHHVTNYLQALELALEFRNLALQLNDTTLLLKSMQYQGAALYYLNRRADCYAIQHQLFNLAQRVKNYAVVSLAASNLIVQCADNNDIDSALFWFNTGIKSNPEQNLSQTAKAYALLVPTLKTSPNTALRQAYADTALTLAYQCKDSTVIGFAHIKQAELFLSQNLNDSAVVHASKAIEIYKALKNTDGITHALSVIILVNERENNPVKALEQYRYYFDTYKAIFSITTAQQMAEFETKFKTAEKERENLILKKDNAEKQLAIALAKKTRNNLIFGSLFVLILVIAIGLAVIFRNKTKQAQQLAELERKRLEAMVDAQNEERIRIARELHDGVAQSLAGLKLAIEFEQLKQLKKEGSQNPLAETWANKVGDVQQEVRMISHDLMPLKLSQMGFHAAVQNTFENTLTPASIQFSLNLTEQVKISQAYEIALFRVLQELLANTIKHAKATRVNCTFKQLNQQLHLTFCDNGIGLQNHNNPGIGLENMQQRIESIGGSIEFSAPSSGSGFCVTIVIPS